MFTMSTSESTVKPPRSDGPSYHHGNLREALLAKGLEMLEAGESDFSLRELTRRVGVSANAVYRHFAGKEALLSAMAAEGFHRLTSAQAMAVQGGTTPATGFLEAGRAYVRFARRHPALFRLMFGRFAASNPDPELRAAAQLSYEGMRFSVAAILRRPVADAEVLATAMRAWSLVHGLSQLIIDGQMDAHALDIDSLVDAVLSQSAFERGLPDS